MCLYNTCLFFRNLFKRNKMSEEEIRIRRLDILPFTYKYRKNKNI